MNKHIEEIKLYDTEARMELVMNYGPRHYTSHVNHMTTEDLRSKSDIAVELAWRDLRIEELLARLEAAEKEIGDWRSIAESATSNPRRVEGVSDQVHEIIDLEETVSELKQRAEAAEARLLVPSDIQLDADRWRAMLNSPAIRILGYAGLQEDKPIDGHYCHFGMEIWSHREPYYDNKKAAELITRYADNIIALNSTGYPVEGGE